MTLMKAMLLGLVQGITEILPISSSGHLVIVQSLLLLPESSRLGLTAALHIGTGLALVCFFARRLGLIVAGVSSRREDERRENWRLVGRVALATVPAVVAGLLIEKRLQALTAGMTAVGILMLLNGTMLVVSRWARSHGRRLTLLPALVIGLAQIAALLPGISRSGVTIVTALFMGVASADAFEFSFLMAIPVTLGAGMYELLKLNADVAQMRELAAGIVVAFLLAMGALWTLRRLVTGGRAWWFGCYCWVVGLLALLR